MRFVLMDRISSGRGACCIESMPIAELPGDSGFALLGESLFPGAEKVTKNALPLHPAPRFARGSFAPSLLQGSAYKGHPWPFKPFAASMRLTPLRNDSALPTEGARVWPATISTAGWWLAEPCRSLETSFTVSPHIGSSQSRTCRRHRPPLSVGRM